MKNNNKPSGTSIVEVLVAIAIVSLISLVFFYIYSNSGRNLAKSRHKLEAMTVARREVEKLLAKDFYDPNLSAPGTYTLNVPVGSLDGLSVTVTYNVEYATNGEDKKITMRVQWSEP